MSNILKVFVQEGMSCTLVEDTEGYDRRVELKTGDFDYSHLSYTDVDVYFEGMGYGSAKMKDGSVIDFEVAGIEYESDFIQLDLIEKVTIGIDPTPEPEPPTPQHTLTIVSDTTDVSLKVGSGVDVQELEIGENMVDEGVHEFLFETVGDRIFKSVSVMMSGWLEYFDISEDGRVASIDKLEITRNRTITIVTEEVIPPEPIIEYGTLKVDNDHPDVIFVSGENKEGEVLDFTETSNQIPVGEWKFKVVTDGRVLVRVRSDYQGYFIDYVISDNGTVAIMDEYIYIGKGRSTTVQIESIPRQDEDLSGSNRLYKVDRKALQELSKERFAVGTVIEGKLYDLGDYIINVLELPFKVVDSGKESKIILGNQLIDVVAPTLTSDRLTIDLGSIEVPRTFGNSYDYVNTSVRLHLPYRQPIEIEPMYAIGHTLSVVYIVDLYFGKVTVNVSSSFVGEVIHTETITVGRNIPFLARSMDVRNSMGNDTSILNGVTVPFVEVIRDELLDESERQFSLEVEKVVVDFSNLVGYIKVMDILLEVECTSIEKSMIIQLLESGVFIK